jgi:hypothetical protein
MFVLLALELPAWFGDAFSVSLALSPARQFGLAFLLGSFAVATWSDVKHLSAQREFLEIWLAFLASVFLYDAYEASQSSPGMWQPLAIKWGLIGVLSLFSLEAAGLPYRLFRLAPADVAALATAACLLTPVLIVLFYVGAKLIAMAIGPFLRRGRRYYPFMPVVSLTTLGVFAVGLFVHQAAL